MLVYVMPELRGRDGVDADTGAGNVVLRGVPGLIQHRARRGRGEVLVWAMPELRGRDGVDADSGAGNVVLRGVPGLGRVMPSPKYVGMRPCTLKK